MTAEELADLPKAHVLRPALPWRDGPVLTECGHLPGENGPVLTREEFITRLKKWGQARTSMTTCMTCYQTASRHQKATWDVSPVAAIRREADWAAVRSNYHPATVNDDPVSQQFHFELLALAELARRHPDEFKGIIEGLRTAPSLDEARRKRRRA